MYFYLAYKYCGTTTVTAMHITIIPVSMPTSIKCACVCVLVVSLCKNHSKRSNFMVKSCKQKPKLCRYKNLKSNILLKIFHQNSKVMLVESILVCVCACACVSVCVCVFVPSKMCLCMLWSTICGKHFLSMVTTI